MYPSTHTQTSDLDDYNKLSLWLCLKINLTFYILAKRNIYLKVSKVFECSLLNICDQTEEAWLHSGLCARLIRWSVLSLMIDEI